MRPYNDTSSIHFVNEDVNKINARKHEAICAPRAANTEHSPEPSFFVLGKKRSTPKDSSSLIDQIEKMSLEVKRMRHQNWLRLNKATGRDRIQFTHKHSTEINFRMQLLKLNSKMLNGNTLYFQNIYQN